MSNKTFNALLGASGPDVPHQIAAEWLAQSGVAGNAAIEVPVNAFVETVNTAGLWSRIIALYFPFAGADLAHKVYNVVDPEDNDYAYRGTITGTPTAVAKGIRFNSVSDVFNTHFMPDQTASCYPNFGTFWYQLGADHQFFGNGIGDSSRFTVDHFFTSTLSLPVFSASAGNFTNGTNAAGFWATQRQDEGAAPDDLVCYYGPSGGLVDSHAIGEAGDATSDDPFKFMGNDTNVTTLTAFGLFTGFTHAEVAILRNAIVTLLTAVGANV